MTAAVRTDTVLALKEIKVHFAVGRGFVMGRGGAVVKAVDGVSLDVRRGEIVGLVGESGCGKSTVARAIVGLAKLTGGSIEVDGRDLSALSRPELRRLRPSVQMIFQDPYASLNPRMTVFDALAEAIRVREPTSGRRIGRAVGELMRDVGLEPRFMRKYPHEFSGGQRQRVALARALALRPRLLIADEPVSALDVSIQAQILNLIAGLRRERELSLLFISHDLSVVYHLSDRIAVMYLGKIVEIAGAEELFAGPVHPYTTALLSAVPVADPDKARTRRRILLEGDPPSPLSRPEGCAFHPRCRFAQERCRLSEPPLEAVPGAGDHRVACVRKQELVEGLIG